MGTQFDITLDDKAAADLAHIAKLSGMTPESLASQSAIARLIRLDLGSDSSWERVSSDGSYLAARVQTPAC
jgi:hypothetical protein